MSATNSTLIEYRPKIDAVEYVEPALNKPDLFVPVEFVEGLNVVIAEIRLPENRNKDTHNLGKTTLGRLLNYGLLMGRNANFFLFKHLNLFEEFVLFLEVELEDQAYITIRRGVSEATKISFKLHKAKHQDFSILPFSDWNGNPPIFSMS